MKEMWKPIEEYPEYFISNYGRLKNKDGLVETQTNTQGFNCYIFNEFSKDEFCVNIDYLVYKYHNNLNYDSTSNILIHINGIRNDDHINNLKEMKFEDYLIKIKSKKRKREEQIQSILNLLNKGELKNVEIGKMFGVSPYVVSYIKKRYKRGGNKK